MQYFDEIARGLRHGRGGAKDFAEFLRALFEAQDDVAEISESGRAFEIRQQTWKLMADVADYHPACAKVLEGLIEGLAAGCGRDIRGHMKPSPAARRRSSGRSAETNFAARNAQLAAFAQTPNASGGMVSPLIGARR